MTIIQLSTADAKCVVSPCKPPAPDLDLQLIRQKLSGVHPNSFKYEFGDDWRNTAGKGPIKQTDG
jgi:hypothetical protein